MTNKKFEMYSYFIKPTNILYGNKLTIIYCISGSFTIIINEIAYNVQKGQFVVINPSDHYQVVRSQKAFGHCFSIDAAIIDKSLIWYGSVNYLGYNTEENNAIRICDSTLAENILEVLYT